MTLSADPTPAPPPPPDERPPIRAWTVWMTVVIIILGGIIGTQILFKKVVPEAARADQRLPYLKRLERDLEATESRGETVRLGQLEGKVYLLSYVYTTCSRGCGGVVEQMKALGDRFRDNPRFRLVAVSVNPSHDTAEVLDRFRRAHDLGDQWWLLTGEQEMLRSYMSGQGGFLPVRDIPPEQRLNEFDLFEHDFRVALVDAAGRIRGYYEVMHPDEGIRGLIMERLENDIREVLAEEVRS